MVVFIPFTSNGVKYNILAFCMRIGDDDDHNDDYDETSIPQKCSILRFILTRNKTNIEFNKL